MDIIVILLLAWFGVTSSLGGEAVASAEGVPAEPPSAPPAPVESPEAFPADVGVPDTDGAIEQRFLSRYPLVGCSRVGEIDAERQGPGVAYDWSCLEDAREEGAEALVVTVNDSGQAVYTYYRLNPGGPMEIFVDRRADGSAASGWGYRQCEPAPDLAVRPCA